MNVNDYKTGNPGMDRLIGIALAKEQVKFIVDPSNWGMEKKTNKYNVAEKKDRTKEGITFASKAEMEEDKDILLEVKAGKYWNLLRQPKFLLTRKKILGDGIVLAASFYVADWMYMDENNIYVVDKKGFKTKEYILKKKMFLEKYQNFVFIER